MTSKDLRENEFHPYYGLYIEQVDSSKSLMQALEEGLHQTLHFFNALPEEKHAYRYEKDKWTCKEVLQHIIDTERIFIYRAFRISRGDRTPLAGFDQNDYMAPSGADQKSMTTLLAEYAIGRNYAISILQGLSEADLSRMGKVDGKPISARAAAFIIAGHELWHCRIIEERYL
jgi:hypothetical protein